MPEYLMPPIVCAMAFGLAFFTFATVAEIFHWIDPENSPSLYYEVWKAIRRDLSIGDSE